MLAALFLLFGLAMGLIWRHKRKEAISLTMATVVLSVLAVIYYTTTFLDRVMS